MTGGVQFSCPKIFCFTLESRLFLSQSPLKRGNWKIFVEMLTVTFKLWLNCAFSVKMFCFKEYKSHFVRQSNLIVPLLWLNRMFYNKVFKTTLKISKFSNFFFVCFHTYVTFDSCLTFYCWPRNQQNYFEQNYFQ